LNNITDGVISEVGTDLFVLQVFLLQEKLSLLVLIFSYLQHLNPSYNIKQFDLTL
jgi:hypothetical protein